MIADQVKGTYDITGGNYVSYIQAQQSGQANLDIFAEGSVMEPGTQGIYTMPDSKITSLAGLKGKTVAINAPKNILYLMAASMMAEKGINPTSVKFVNVPFPEMATELTSGAIDAALLPEPFASQAEESYGAVPLVDLDQGATTSFPVAGYVVTKQWATKYPRTLAAFYRALEEGQRTRRQQPRRRRAGDGGPAGQAGAARRLQGRRRRSWPWTAIRLARDRSAAWTWFG